MSDFYIEFVFPDGESSDGEYARIPKVEEELTIGRHTYIVTDVLEFQPSTKDEVDAVVVLKIS